MSELLRFDRGVITRFQDTAEGFLETWLTVSRVGPLEYLRSDGSIETELVTPEELFKPDSLATARFKPISLLHPDEGLITPANARKYQRGMTGHDALNVNDQYLTLVGCVTDAETIQAIKSGEVAEVSAGYVCRVVRGDDGNLYQRDRVYNHFAAVPKGRAGEDVKFHVPRGDSAVTRKVLDVVEFKESKKMSKQLILDGVGYPIEDEALLTKLVALQTRADSLGSEVQTLKTEKDALVAEKSELEGKLTAANTKLDEAVKAQEQKLDADQVGQEVKARLDAWKEVLPWFRKQSPDFEPDITLDAAAIQRTYLEKRTGQKLDGKSPEFIAGLYAGLKPTQEQPATQKADSSQGLLNLVKTQDAIEGEIKTQTDAGMKMTAMRNRKNRRGKLAGAMAAEDMYGKKKAM